MKFSLCHPVIKRFGLFIAKAFQEFICSLGSVLNQGPSHQAISFLTYTEMLTGVLSLFSEESAKRRIIPNFSQLILGAGDCWIFEIFREVR